ncbi:MAG: MGMT family protein [Candidatus Gottesmanbacteria bacterium]|nr:MGMT family protein [Candidatus Gottesmanbacteria bacterium]
MKKPIELTPLAKRTYQLLKKVPRGRVTTYKALADALGTKAYHAIGQFMKHNPYSYPACPERSRRVPCHRVVASDGTIGGFMGANCGGEIAKKIRMLRMEGIKITGKRITDFPTVLFPFPAS